VKIKQHNRSAFTLIELILAIGIASIVLVAVNAVFFAALKLRNVTSDAVEEATPLDRAITVIRRDLQCVVPPQAGGMMTGYFKAGNVISLGVSEPVAAEMYTATGALSDDQPWGDIQRVTYELKASGSGSVRDLYRTVARNLLTYATPEVQDQLMIKGVSRVDFWCYDGSRWENSWDTTDITSLSTNLPVAVRVEIELMGGGANAAAPIEIVVPIDSQSLTNSTETTEDLGI
jgi:type II secretion system protein J